MKTELYYEGFREIFTQVDSHPNNIKIRLGKSFHANLPVSLEI